jgi:hypothetical protein
MAAPFIVPGDFQQRASGFTPLTIPGCVSWFDSADLSTMNLSITQWRDKSGAGNHYSPFSTSFPTYEHAVRGVNIANQTQGLGAAANISLISEGQTTIFLVLRVTTGSGATFTDLNSFNNLSVILLRYLQCGSLQ